MVFIYFQLAIQLICNVLNLITVELYGKFFLTGYLRCICVYIFFILDCFYSHTLCNSIQGIISHNISHFFNHFDYSFFVPSDLQLMKYCNKISEFNGNVSHIPIPM